ncbi:MAG: hypothetical protein RJA98_3089 [Pseudomonadota bacterium]
MARLSGEHAPVPGRQGARWWLAGVALALSAVVAAAAWSTWSSWRTRLTGPVDPVVQRMRDTGVLRVGYAVEAPYAWVDDSGNVTGESPETARLVAHALGARRIDWVQVPFDALLTELMAGRFDVVAAGLFVTPARQARVLFSDPTLRVGAGLLVRVTDAPAAAGPDPRSRPGFRVAVVLGSVEAERLAHWLPAASAVVVPDVQTARAALLVGQADAVALSWPTLARIAQGSQGQLVAFRLPVWPGAAADHVAFAFHPEHPGLRDAWNLAQRDVLGGPAHLAILQRFNLGADDLVRPAAGAGARP